MRKFADPDTKEIGSGISWSLPNSVILNYFDRLLLDFNFLEPH